MSVAPLKLELAVIGIIKVGDLVVAAHPLTDEVLRKDLGEPPYVVTEVDYAPLTPETMTVPMRFRDGSTDYYEAHTGRMVPPAHPQRVHLRSEADPTRRTPHMYNGSALALAEVSTQP